MDSQFFRVCKKHHAYLEDLRRRECIEIHDKKAAMYFHRQQKELKDIYYIRPLQHNRWIMILRNPFILDYVNGRHHIYRRLKWKDTVQDARGTPL